jgi:alpha-1,2-mannosyltransferase
MGLRSLKATSFAYLLLGLSLTVHFLLLALLPKWTMIDLMVYWHVPPALLNGALYTTDTGPISDFPLRFTYPPFAAIVLMPLSLMSATMARWLWQIISVVCLWWLIRSSCCLVAKHREIYNGSVESASVWNRRTIAWTAFAMWLEPVRTTLDFGQINLILAGIVLAGTANMRPLPMGGAIGLTAGIKVLPAVLGFYLLAARQWRAALWAGVVFLATVGVGYAVSARQSNDYWFNLLWQIERVGETASWNNQSLRGVASRIAGFDVSGTPVLTTCVLAALVLYLFALRGVLRRNDTLGGLVTTQLIALLIAPISWSHHWVWVIPTLIWLVYGTGREQSLVRAAAWLWLITTSTYLIGIPHYLTFWTGVSMPGWSATLLEAADPFCALFTLTAMGIVTQRHNIRVEQPPGAAAGQIEGMATRA